jgi:hypothetical protein
MEGVAELRRDSEFTRTKKQNLESNQKYVLRRKVLSVVVL